MCFSSSFFSMIYVRVFWCGGEYSFLVRAGRSLSGLGALEGGICVEWMCGRRERVFPAGSNDTEPKMTEGTHACVRRSDDA